MDESARELALGDLLARFQFATLSELRAARTHVEATAAASREPGVAALLDVIADLLASEAETRDRAIDEALLRLVEPPSGPPG